MDTVWRTQLVAVACMIIALSACSRDKGALVAESASGNVIMYVSNQCLTINPVEIAVQLDGQPLIRRTFGYTGLHSDAVEYQFEWGPGHHSLFASSVHGNVFVEQRIDVVGNVWVLVEYLCGARGDQEPRLKITCQDRPFSFR